MLLLATSSAIALGFGETVMRLAGHHLLGEGEEVSIGSVFNRQDSPLGISFIPDARGMHLSGGNFAVSVRINSAGFRDMEHREEAIPGRKRILILGDSFMYGQGVRDTEILARRLEGRIPGIEVINTGVPGYDLGQEYLYYKNRGYRWHPDLVLVAFFVNDLLVFHELDATYGPDGLPVSYSRRSDLVERDRKREASSSGPGPAVREWLLSHSLLYTFVRSRLMEVRTRLEGAPPVEAGPPKIPYLPYFLAEPDEITSRAWERAYLILDDLTSRVSATGSRLAVILVPAAWQLSESRWRSWSGRANLPEKSLSRWEPQERVGAWCRRTPTPCLDLREAFLPKDTSRLYFLHDGHWTAEGHDLAARALADFLEAQALP